MSFGTNPAGATITILRWLASLGLLSAYHKFHGEQQGGESRPPLYWRDRRKDGPTYHIDYVFLPDPWIRKVKELRLGRFEDWCGAGLSDHVPVIVDVGL
jgi:exonuclease III